MLLDLADVPLLDLTICLVLDNRIIDTLAADRRESLAGTAETVTRC